MKIFSTLLAATCLTTTVISAQESIAATPFSDFTLELNYSKQLDNDYDNVEVGGSLSGDIGAGIGYQVDFYRLEYTNYPNDDIYGGTFHLTYDINANLAVGVFTGHESWEGTPYDFVGFEAQYTTGAVTLSGVGFVYDDDTNIGSVSAVYAFDNGFDLGLELGYYEDYDMTYAITASKEVAYGINLNGRVLDTRDEGYIVTLGASRDFGAGAKFRRADYLSFFNVW